MTGANGDSPASAGRQTSDYGATWSALASPLLTGKNLAMDIQVPFHDNSSESIAYFGYRDKTAAVQRVYRVSGVTQTDITPVDGSARAYSIDQVGKGAITTCAVDRQSVVMIGNHLNDFADSPTHFAGFASRDGGTTWSILYGPDTSNTYRQAAIDGSNSNIIYLWGNDGRVGYATDFATVDERGPGGSARIVGITGD
jgi:hypothetical protein